MVPWYTIEPPTSGLCPKHCTCATNIIDHDVGDILEGYYENHVVRITEQLQRTPASKEHLLHYAASTYWEAKADLLKVPPHLMDLSAPLPPCVTRMVERQIDGMMEDFDDLEEWFFAFPKAPSHEKESILLGYEDGSYTATLKKRREDRATDLARMQISSVSDESLPIFGSPFKKLKQSTLTQSFEEKIEVFPSKEVIDLTDKQALIVTDRKSKSLFDLTTKPSYLSPPSVRLLVQERDHTDSARTPAVEPPRACQFSYTTPPQDQKKRG
jgi:hypothetical protein